LEEVALWKGKGWLQGLLLLPQSGAGVVQEALGSANDWIH
jgi:hypothetical protein